MMFIKKFKQCPFTKEEKGSFTLEATLLFPILIILVLLFIFFSLVIYEKVTLQYKANRIASQLAHSWTSSTKDWMTGEIDNNGYVTLNGDGLYWRLTGNNFLAKTGIDLGDNGLVSKKIAKAGSDASHVSYENGLFGQKIIVTLERQLSLPQFVTDLFGIDKLETTASYPVVEPVEMIRNTDLMLYGIDKFKDVAAEYIPFFNNQ